MRVSNILILLIAVCLSGFITSCKKVIVQDKVYDNVIYDVGNKVVYTNAAEKTRQKSFCLRRNGGRY